MGGDGKDFVAAMQELYSLYDERCIEWYAGLYSHKEGGFYFATSGRDSAEHLPDIEATHACLAFFEKFEGVCNYREVTPDWMKERIGRWVKGLQDPGGYFYHPQWPRELIDLKVNRKGRDLCYGLGILASCGFRPTYDTPTGEKGDGLLPDGTPVKRPQASAVSNEAEAPKGTSTVVYTEHLQSVESFKKYLEENTEKLQKKPYPMGNMIANQVGQIVARDKELLREGATESLRGLLVDWFNANQNPETGNWYHFEEGDDIYRVAFEGTNSLLKIIDVYNQLGAELHYPLEAARSVMKVLLGDIPATTVCDMYNTWYAISQVITNIDRYSTLSEDKKKEYIATIRSELLRDAPFCIRGMKRKLEIFKRPDHAFSYCWNGTSITSQGVPCALPGYDESDTNASGIVLGGCNNHIYGALGLTRIKPFDGELLKKYLALLEKRRAESAV